MELTITRGRNKGQVMTITTSVSQYGDSWELTNPSRKRKNPEPEAETKRPRTDEPEASVANAIPRRNILDEYEVSDRQVRDITNSVADDLLKDKDVELAANQFNKDGKGTKDNPNVISSATNIIGGIKHYRDTKQNLPKEQSRTRHYQFGEQKHTRVSEDVKNYPNAFVRGGGRYDPHVLQTFESMKNSNNLDDQDLAAAMNTLVRDGAIPSGMLNRGQEKKLTEITYLIFGRESVRNKRNLVQASILFSQVEKGRISIEDAVTQLPMSPDGAQSSAKRLDDLDSGTKPYPREGTGVYKRVEEVQQKETDVINDFIADEMKKDGIEQFNSQQELIEYVEGKIRREVFLTYGIDLN